MTTRAFEILVTTIGGGRRRWLSMRVDRTAANVAYYGLSESANADAAAPVWLIIRETAQAANHSVFEAGFADNGRQFQTLVWDDRASYFPAPPGQSVPNDEFQLEGISQGRISPVTLTNATWTPLHPSPGSNLAGRKALNIQNTSGDEIKIHYDNAAVGYVGVSIGSGSERYYAYNDTIIVYAKLKTLASADIQIEELA